MSKPRTRLTRLAYMTNFVQVSTATPTREQAIELARSVVGERLAAGAQIVGPVISAFWHDGEFGTGEEWQLLLKTTRTRYPENWRPICWSSIPGRSPRSQPCRSRWGPQVVWTGSPPTRSRPSSSRGFGALQNVSDGRQRPVGAELRDDRLEALPRPR